MNKIILCSIGFIFLLTSCGGPGNKYAALAQCLTEKGVKEYGAFWCPNCAKQKKSLGDAYQYITYIECDPRGENQQTDLCLSKKVEKYPTWEFPDGTTLVGVQDLQVLADKSGCPLTSTAPSANQ